MNWATHSTIYIHQKLSEGVFVCKSGEKSSMSRRIREQSATKLKNTIIFHSAAIRELFQVDSIKEDRMTTGCHASTWAPLPLMTTATNCSRKEKDPATLGTGTDNVGEWQQACLKGKMHFVKIQTVPRACWVPGDSPLLHKKWLSRKNWQLLAQPHVAFPLIFLDESWTCV